MPEFVSIADLTTYATNKFLDNDAGLILPVHLRTWSVNFLYSFNTLTEAVIAAYTFPAPTWASITGKPSFFSGSYNDLTDKPRLASQEDTIPFEMLFDDPFPVTWVTSISGNQNNGHAFISSGNSVTGDIPAGVTDYVVMWPADPDGNSISTQLGAIQVGDWFRAKSGTKFIIAQIQYINIAVGTEYEFGFNPSTDESATLLYDLLPNGSGEVSFYRHDVSVQLQFSDINGVLSLSQIPSIPTTKITGTFAQSKIPNIPTSKITGNLAYTRITDVPRFIELANVHVSDSTLTGTHRLFVVGTNNVGSYTEIRDLDAYHDEHHVGEQTITGYTYVTNSGVPTAGNVNISGSTISIRPKAGVGQADVLVNKIIKGRKFRLYHSATRYVEVKVSNQPSFVVGTFTFNFTDRVNVGTVLTNNLSVELRPQSSIPATDDLAEVAFSGSYNDLDDTPDIPDAYTLTIAEEGTDLDTGATKLNFTGSGVTASGTGAEKTINIPGETELTVADDGTDLSTGATKLNFTGDGVTASGTGATKTVHIPEAPGSALGDTESLTNVTSTWTDISTQTYVDDDFLLIQAQETAGNYWSAVLLAKYNYFSTAREMRLGSLQGNRFEVQQSGSKLQARTQGPSVNASNIIQVTVLKGVKGDKGDKGDDGASGGINMKAAQITTSIVNSVDQAKNGTSYSGLEVTITPSAATKKILLQLSGRFWTTANNTSNIIAEIDVYDSANQTYTYVANFADSGTTGFAYLDSTTQVIHSPNTTSAVTYRVRISGSANSYFRITTDHPMVLVATEVD